MAGVFNPLNDIQTGVVEAAMQHMSRSASSVTFNTYPSKADESRKIGIMRAHDHPRVTLTTASTFGLCHNTWHHINFPYRLELVMAWKADTTIYERLLAIVAENIIVTGQMPKLGTIFDNASKHADQDFATNMPHALTIIPSIWGDNYTQINLDGEEKIWFQQVVPIYEDEALFIEKNGMPAFEEMIERHLPKFEDLSRPSLVAN